MVIKTVATNRKARHNYFVQDGEEAGIALMGSEIKSIREGRVSLNDAYIRPEGGELWLVGAHIARYQAASYLSHDPARRRKILMHRKQIKNLQSKVAEKGLTLLPLRIYIKGHLAKLEIALGKGKKLYDKRDSITRRDVKRDLQRTMKQNK
jgi:SsrA-binding protein